MLLFSVICVVLSLEFGVATPQGNRLKESNIHNKGNNEFNIERNDGPTTKNQNKFIPEENVVMQNENYENNIAKNNPAAYRNMKEQPNVISEKKEYIQITPERNFNHLNDYSPSSSYIASLPQVDKFQTFRPKDGVKNEANLPRMGDILSEVNNPNNYFVPIESNPTIIKERIPSNQIINGYNRQDLQTPEKLSDKKEEEDDTQFDVPVATPEYIQSLLNEDKQTQNSNAKSMITNLPRNSISNKNLQSNTQNVNDATSQNPSAEILYETGQAKPYEITKDQLSNSRHGNKHAHNILHDKQKLKNLYLSSKPKKHYMVVYPDGRVEEVDQLDKIKKMHPNFVMLNAKELLKQSETKRKVSTGLQESTVNQNLSKKNTTMKSQLTSIKDIKDDQMDKVPKTVDKQSLPVPIDSFSITTERNIISTSEVITKTNNIAKTSKDEVLIKLNTENNTQKQSQENIINDNQKKNKTHNIENAKSGSIATTSDISKISVTESKDIATTVRSTKSIATDTEILNQNSSNSLESSKNSDKLTLSKEQENINTTSSSILINTKYERVTDDTNNSTAALDSHKEESNTITKTNNETKVTSEDGNGAGGNTETIITNYNYENISNSSAALDSYREESNSVTKINETGTIEDGNGGAENNETITNYSYENTSNSAPALDSYREESNSITKTNNETKVTSEDGKDAGGKNETIITNYNYDTALDSYREESNSITKINNETKVTSEDVKGDGGNTETIITNYNYENTNNSSAALDSYKEESNSITKTNNKTGVTVDDGNESGGNTETITNYSYESTAQNLESNNGTSSADNMMLVTTSDKSDIVSSSLDDPPDNAKPLNDTSSTTFTNNTLHFQENSENNDTTTTILHVSNVSNSEVEEPISDDNSLKPNSSNILSNATYTNASSYNTPDEVYDVRNSQDESNSNKTFISNIDDDVSEPIPRNIPDASNNEDGSTDTEGSNENNVTSLDGAFPLNREDTNARDTELNDLYYSNSPQKQLIEVEDDVDDQDEVDDEDDAQTERVETTNENENLETESPSTDGNGVNESSFWFNANDSFWNRLMNSNERNSFYFLFPRPRPNAKETKKTIYPNGTIVIETTEDEDGDGEITTSKTVLTCGNFTICEKKS